VPWLYRLRVEEFALQRLQRIQNSERLFVVSGRAKKASPRLRVLREVLGSYKTVRDQLDYVPALYAHTLVRMSDVLDADEAIERHRAGLIALRDALREQLQPTDMDTKELRRISRLPSISSQIEAYRSADTDRAFEVRKQRGQEKALRVDGALSELITGTMTETTTSLLSILATQLKPPTSGPQR
jgi:hypothetical protein